MKTSIIVNSNVSCFIIIIQLVYPPHLLNIREFETEPFISFRVLFFIILLSTNLKLKATWLSIQDAKGSISGTIK